MGEDLGSRLLAAGLASRQQLASALSGRPAQGGRLVLRLLDAGLNEDALVGFFLSEGFGPVAKGLQAVPQAILDRIRGDMAHGLMALPLREGPEGLVVAMADPSDSHSLAELRFATGADVVAVVARPRHLEAALAGAYPQASNLVNARPLSEPPIALMPNRAKRRPAIKLRSEDEDTAGAQGDVPVPLVQRKPMPTPARGVSKRTFHKPPPPDESEAERPRPLRPPTNWKRLPIPDSTEAVRPHIPSPASLHPGASMPKVQIGKPGPGSFKTTQVEVPAESDTAQHPPTVKLGEAPGNPLKATQVEEPVDAGEETPARTTPIPTSAPEKLERRPSLAAQRPSSAAAAMAPSPAEGSEPTAEPEAEPQATSPGVFRSIIPEHEANWGDLNAELRPAKAPRNRPSNPGQSHGRNTRGPVDIGATLISLRNATDRDEVVRLACQGAITVARSAVLLALRKGVLRGWDSAGTHVSVDAIRNLWIPASAPSMFRQVLDEGISHSGPFGTSAADNLYRAATGSRGGHVVIHPIELRGRRIAVLCADDVRFGEVGHERLQLLADEVANALTRIILAGKG